MPVRLHEHDGKGAQCSSFHASGWAQLVAQGVAPTFIPALMLAFCVTLECLTQPRYPSDWDDNDWLPHKCMSLPIVPAECYGELGVIKDLMGLLLCFVFAGVHGALPQASW